MTVIDMPNETVGEESFQALCEASFDAVLVHRRGHILAANEKCAAMMKCAVPDLVGRNVLDFTSPKFHHEVLRHVRQRDPRPFEAVGLRTNGESFPIEVCGVTTRGSDIRIVSLRDITERTMAEKELRAREERFGVLARAVFDGDETERRTAEARILESERRYRELAEASHDLICDHDLDGRILTVNAAVVRTLGRTREELCAMSLRDLLVPEALPLFDEYIATISANGVAEGLMVLRTPDGARRVWHYRNAMRLTGLERPVVRGLAHDVTEREEALAALRHSEQHFRSIIENGSDVIGIIDNAGRLTYYSPSAERLLGATAETMRNVHFSKFVHPEHLERAEEFFQKQVTTPNLVSTVDLRVGHAEGGWRWLSIVGTTIRGADGLPSIIANGRDVTARRRLEAQLEQANRLTSLGQLAATVAHEFNNVLMSMQPFADLIQRPGISEEVIARGARHISNSIARGKRVVLDMLRFARPAEPSMAPIDLQRWWEHLVPELQAPMGNNIEFTWSFAPDLHVLADAAQLSQVFANLVSNARDAMPLGGRLRVTATRPNAGVSTHIVVEDTGTGMPEHVLRHAFDPLFTTKQNGGTGLGLAVAHQVVTRHGGMIFAESKPGTGTKFHLFLPLTEKTVAVEIADANIEPAIRASKVLIVDDEPSIGEGIAIALRDRGLTARAVETGREAEGAAQEMDPDVAIIDIRLADMDGLDVGRLLRTRFPKLKLVFASGHADTRSALEFSGATFLQKPFDIAELIVAVAALEAKESR